MTLPSACKRPVEGTASGAAPSASASAGTVGGTVPAVDHGELDQQAPKDSPQIGSLVIAATVYKLPDVGSRKLGYIRLGGTVARDADPVPGRGCKGKWYRVYPMGHVCTDEASIDLSAPLVARGVAPTRLEPPLPYNTASCARPRRSTCARLAQRARKERVQAGRAPRLVPAKPRGGAEGSSRRQRRSARRARRGNARGQPARRLSSSRPSSVKMSFFGGQTAMIRCLGGWKADARSRTCRATTCPNTRLRRPRAAQDGLVVGGRVQHRQRRYVTPLRDHVPFEWEYSANLGCGSKADPSSSKFGQAACARAWCPSESATAKHPRRSISIWSIHDSRE